MGFFQNVRVSINKESHRVHEIFPLNCDIMQHITAQDLKPGLSVSASNRILDYKHKSVVTWLERVK